ARRIVIDGASAVMSPPGIAAERVSTPADVRDTVGSLIDVALPDSAVEPPPLLPLVAKSEASTDGSPKDGPAEHRRLVRVLGRVEVDGAALDRRLSEELTVYLALHPDGADEQRL